MIVRLNPLTRKLHTSHSTGREFCGGHVEKANFATLGVVLSFIFEGFEAELWVAVRVWRNISLFLSIRCQSSMVWRQFQLEVKS